MSAVTQINDRIRGGQAVVSTLDELCVLPGYNYTSGQPDVVTLAFTTGISGTAAMLCVPVAERGVFTRAAAISLNGVRGHPGPAPNERLGVVDALIFADEHAADGGTGYDGATLIVDLLCGKAVEVECRAVEGSIHRNSIRLDAIEFARLYTYNAALPMAVPAAVLDVVLSGSCIILNGSAGIVVGSGTRHRADAPTLSLAADLRDMDPSLMSSTRRNRPQHTLAIAVPIANSAGTAALVAWAQSSAASSLLAPSALEAAARLRRLVQEGRFLLSETAIPAPGARR